MDEIKDAVVFDIQAWRRAGEIALDALNDEIDTLTNHLTVQIAKRDELAATLGESAKSVVKEEPARKRTPVQKVIMTLLLQEGAMTREGLIRDSGLTQDQIQSGLRILVASGKITIEGNMIQLAVD